MRIRKIIILFLAVLCPVTLLYAQKRGMKSITIDELKIHMNIIAAEEFLGRDTPSQGLKIASRYLAIMAESYGLKSLMPDGSYYQEIPLEIFTINESKTRIILSGEFGERVYYFPDAFGIGGRSKPPEGIFSGGIVFVGFGVSEPGAQWDDYADVDVDGKVVVMLDGSLSSGHRLTKKPYRRHRRHRVQTAYRKGAVAVLMVLRTSREKNIAEKGVLFDNYDRGIFVDNYSPRRNSSVSKQTKTPVTAEIRHDVAAEILGISREALEEKFEMLSRGEQVPAMELPDRDVTVTVHLRKRSGHTQNVIGYIEGSDRKLKDEYIVYGSHHDHIGIHEGLIYNGADDNVSGTAAMLEITQAMVKERPKRSVIMVWHTGEEMGMKGAYYFINNCPVPPEKISAVINFDMICRNHPDSLYLIASKTLSTELDDSIHKMNDKYKIDLNFDYKYEDINHPNRFYYRSDQYPYNLYGVPGVWLFCGTTRDYHKVTDTISRVDYKKMLKVTKLAYLAGYDIGNKKRLLELDVYPEIKTRGKHNIQIQRQREDDN